MSETLDDFLSQDTSRVLHAVWTVRESRDPALFDELVGQLARIRSSTESLDLGGIIYSNYDHLEHALETVENYRRGLCWCTNYADTLLYNPETEQDKGRVTIVSTSTPAWDMTFECTCTVCGRQFSVEQGNYHAMWWAWTGRGEPTARPDAR